MNTRSRTSSIMESDTVPENKRRKMNDIESELKDFLECPICNQSLMQKIYSCSNGHPICQQCNSMVNSCPKCRATSIQRSHGLERLCSTISSCPLFRCPYEGCNQFFTKTELKAHKFKCLYLPYFYPVNTNKYFYDLDEYLEFIKSETTFVYHQQEKLNDPIKKLKIYLDDGPIKHLFNFVDDQVLIYLLGSVLHNKIQYSMYYQVYPGMNLHTNKRIKNTFTINPKKKSKTAYPNDKMFYYQVILEQNAINILDLARDPSPTPPHNDFTRSISLNYDIWRPFLSYSKDLLIKLKFELIDIKEMDFDDIESEEGIDTESEEEILQ